MSQRLYTEEAHRAMYEALKAVRAMFESPLVTEVGRANVCEKVDHALDFAEGKRDEP